MVYCWLNEGDSNDQKESGFQIRGSYNFLLTWISGAAKLFCFCATATSGNRSVKRRIATKAVSLSMPSKLITPGKTKKNRMGL